MCVPCGPHQPPHLWEEEDLQSSAEGIQEDLRKQKAPQKDPNGGEGWLGSS